MASLNTISLDTTWGGENIGEVAELISVWSPAPSIRTCSHWSLSDHVTRILASDWLISAPSTKKSTCSGPCPEIPAPAQVFSHVRKITQPGLNQTNWPWFERNMLPPAPELMRGFFSALDYIASPSPGIKSLKPVALHSVSTAPPPISRRHLIMSCEKWSQPRSFVNLCKIVQLKRTKANNL